MSNQQSQGGTLPNQPEPQPSKPVSSTQATNPSPYPNAPVHNQPQSVPSTSVPSTQAQNNSPYPNQQRQPAPTMMQSPPRPNAGVINGPKQFGVPESVYNDVQSRVPPGSTITSITKNPPGPTEVVSAIPPDASRGFGGRWVTAQRDMGYSYSYLTPEQIKQNQQAQQANELNTQFQTIQRQDVVFNEALNQGKITPEQYQTAIKFQNQQQITLIEKARNANLISSEDAQKDTSQITANQQLFDSALITYQTNKQSNQASVDFWNSQNLPQYAGKYAPVDVPKGYTIAGVTETPFVGPMLPGQTRPSPTIQISFKQSIGNTSPSSTSSPDFFGQMQAGANSIVKGINDFVGKNPAVATITGTTPKIPIDPLGSGFQNPLSPANARSPLLAPLANQPLAARQTELKAMGLVGVALVAPMFVPISTVGILGAGAVNIGVSQVMRFLPSNPITGEYQGTFSSPQQMLDQALIGESMAVGVTGLMSGLGSVAASQIIINAEGAYAGSLTTAGRIAANLAWTAPGRIALFTGISTGIGYIVDPTPAGAARGAATGFIFSSIVESLNFLNTKYDVTGRIPGKVQDFVINKNLAGLEKVNTSYEDAGMKGELWQPSLSERLLMKATGLHPVEPSLGIVELATIPTNTKPGIAEVRARIESNTLPDYLKPIIKGAVEKYNIPEPTVEFYDKLPVTGPTSNSLLNRIRLDATESHSQQQISLAHELGHIVENTALASRGVTSRIVLIKDFGGGEDLVSFGGIQGERITQLNAVSPINPIVEKYDVEYAKNGIVPFDFTEWVQEKTAWDIAKTLPLDIKAKIEFDYSMKHDLGTYEGTTTSSYDTKKTREDLYFGKPKKVVFSSNKPTIETTMLEDETSPEYQSLYKQRIGNKVQLNMAGPNSIIIGKSASPEDFYTPAPIKPGNNYISKDILAKTELAPTLDAEFIKEQETLGINIEYKGTDTPPTQPLSFIKPPTTITTDLSTFELTPEEIRNYSQNYLKDNPAYTKDIRSSHSVGGFSKPTPMKLKDVKGNIQNLGTKLPLNKGLDNEVKEAQKFTVPDHPGEYWKSVDTLNKEETTNAKTESDIFWEKYWKKYDETVGQKAASPKEPPKTTGSAKQQTVTVEKERVDPFTGEKAASPTGIEKIVADYQAGRTVDTTRYEQPSNYGIDKNLVPSILRGVAPFPGQKRRTQTADYESPYEVYSYPDSGIAKPKIAPLLNTESGVASQTLQRQSNPTAFLGLSQMTPLTFAIKQEPIQIQPQDSKVAQDQESLLVQDQPLMLSTIPKQLQTPIQENYFPDSTKNIFSFTPSPGFKFDSGAQDMFTPPRKSGLLSRKRLYPILLPEELFGLPKRRKGR